MQGGAVTAIRQAGYEARSGLTLAAIGRRAGVSKATVSKVLNGRAGVSDETRQRVQLLLDIYGYPRGVTGADGPTHRSNLVDVMVTDFHDPSVAMLMAGCERGAAGRGLDIVPSLVSDPVPDEALTRILARGSHGVVLVSAGLTPEQHRRLEAHGIPSVVITDERPLTPVGRTVSIDHEAGVRHATDHLLSLGHRRIGLVLGPRRSTGSEQRWCGYATSLSAHGIRVDPALIRCGDLSPDAGEIFTEALLEADDPPTALVMADDRVAVGAYRAVETRGGRVGEDLSIIGSADRPQASWLRPELSTIRIPGAAVAEAAVQLLTDPEPVSSEIVITPKLIKRRSARPRSRQAMVLHSARPTGF